MNISIMSFNLSFSTASMTQSFVEIPKIWIIYCLWPYTFIQIGPNLTLYQIFSAEKPKTTLHCPMKAKVCSELTNESLFAKINFVVFSFSAEKI